MATPVDISNLALSHLGALAKVSALDGSDTSAQARNCAIFYPLARDVALESHDWNFASRRVKLAEIAVDPDTYPEFEHAYLLPADFVRLIGVVDEYDRDYPRRVETLNDGSRVLLCDSEPALMYVRYVFRETNTARYPSSFVMYVSYLLAGMLCGPERKDSKRKEVEAAAAQAFLRAAGVDSNADATERHARARFEPPWVKGR